MLDQLMKNLGKEKFKIQKADLDAYGQDWTTKYSPNPLAIYFPETTQDVCQALKYCNQHQIPVVPSGGRTGLSAGCVATNQELVISLEKLNKIGDVDPIGMTIHAQAGVVTELLQQKCDEAGFFFPIDLAAKGSSHIGGNIATNAGGLKVIRYGNTRENVVGIEVVLASGEVLNLDKRLVKDNSGYDLKQLFISSEGTLGIITAATIKVWPKPSSVALCCIALDDFNAIGSILSKANKKKLNISAFEFFTHDCLGVVLKGYPNLSQPTSEKAEYYLLMEFEDTEESVIEEFFSEIFEEGYVVDATLSTSSEQTKSIWSLREFLSESISTHKYVKKNDVSVRVDQISDLVLGLNKLEKSFGLKETQLLLFGHIGDGNVHVNYVSDHAFKDYKEFSQSINDLEAGVAELLRSLNGSISAEHGIGLLKKEILLKFKSQTEMTLMREIKKVFDPNGVLNPGKIFD